MKGAFEFGERVEGYSIPVLNEREIRAAAGILFVMMLVSIMSVALAGNFLYLKYAIVIFLTDIMIRVLIHPRYAPTLIMGRWIVRNQVPEYVGAPQKQFAWIIGVLLGLTMFILMVVLNTHSFITGLICFICLIFLFFETAFGICLGCKFYPLFFKDRVQHCPGEVCDINDRQEIQKTSRLQSLIVLAFIVYVTGVVFLFNDTLVQPPVGLFGSEELAY